nr:MAG TPA: hypothetical protein [Caudoviricetes sp.]
MIATETGANWFPFLLLAFERLSKYYQNSLTKRTRIA